jgi:hypothetical protein
MEDRSKHFNFKSALQTFALVALEAILTFLLDSDKQSKKLAQRLIRQQSLVELRVSFPSMVIFVTFNSRGVLLDAQRPERPIDAVIMASLADLIRGFFVAPAASLRRIQIDGPIELIEELRALMDSFNLQKMIRHLLDSERFKSFLIPTKNISDDDETFSTGRSSRHKSVLLKKLNQQQLLVDQMNLQAKEQTYLIDKLRKRMKILIIIGTTLMVSLTVGLIVTLLHL